MPDKMSAEKINALRAYGARVVITPLVEPDHPDYYCNVAKRLSKEISGAFLANQYFNPDNPRAHEESTGPEIWSQMQGKLDLFVAGLGTGGTFTGTTRYLKKKHSGMKAVGVDPVGSIYYGMVREKKPSEAGSYLTEGVGEDMMPGTVDLSLCDDCVQVNDDEAFGATRMLAQKEGLLVGGSCGMAFYGLAQYLMLHELQGGAPLRATVILPDSGSRYLSKVFNSPWLEKNNLKAGWGDAAFTGDVVYQGAARRVEGV
jgi:cystathionine beta-synthase